MTSLFVRVAEELHHQCWLGFEPSRRDGKVHEIQVRIKRQGMTARPAELPRARRPRSDTATRRRFMSISRRKFLGAAAIAPAPP